MEIKKRAVEVAKLIENEDGFSIVEPKSEAEIWFEWIKYQMKSLMKPESAVFIIMVLILANAYKMQYSQNEKLFQLMSKIDSRISDIENQVNFLFIRSKLKAYKEHPDKPAAEPEPEGWLNNIPVLSEIPKQSDSSSTTSLPSFNAANFLFGASVDTSRSSSSNLCPFIGFDQSSLVLVDRSEPPANKAWCTTDENPVLTVNLAKYVKPTAVSYQHSKYDRDVPIGAPQKYSVFACLDYHCKQMKLLVDNCGYEQTKRLGQEQLCQVPIEMTETPIVKVQFRFNENYGNADETCVGLVRVYGEAKDVPKISERTKEGAEACSNFKENFYNNPISYTLSHKNCTVLYSEQCCEECPECCAECDIQDFNRKTIEHGFAYFLVGVSMVIPIFFLVLILCELGPRNTTKNRF